MTFKYKTNQKIIIEGPYQLLMIDLWFQKVSAETIQKIVFVQWEEPEFNQQIVIQNRNKDSINILYQK